MEIIIHGLNMKVHEATETYARKKLDRLDRYLPGITDLRLELSQQNVRRGGDLSIAQITVRHRRGAVLRTEERVGGSLEAAINLAVDKMYRRIERFKGRRINHKPRDRFALSPEELQAAEEIPELEEEAAEIDLIDEVIVRRKHVTISAMTEDEAIEQMELLGHTFFIYFNAETGNANVVYKRHDSGYGVLLPQVE